MQKGKKGKGQNKTGTKKSQGFKNKTAYKVRYKQNLLDYQKNAVLDRVCQRCYEQLQWKLQYGKYKGIKQPKKCVNCKQKAILKPYRLLCNKCGDDLKKCTKCMEDGPYCSESYKHVPQKVKVRKMALAENELKKMTLRCKNRIIRMWDEELIKFQKGVFLYREDDKPVEGLVYKKKFRDDDDDDEFDEMFGDGLEGNKDDVPGNKQAGTNDLVNEVTDFVPQTSNNGIKISF